MTNRIYPDDLGGFIFDKLIIACSFKRKNILMCLCECDCGEWKEIRRNALVSERVKSCGCYQSERLSIDLTGTKIGILTLVERIPERGKKTKYKCICDCGNERIYNGSNIVKSSKIRIVSCGCLAKEKLKKAILQRNWSGENHPYWKGGVVIDDLALYDTYAPQLELVEECRRDPENFNLLQVKCSYCGKFYTTKGSLVQERLRFIHGKRIKSESRFYCEDPSCKENCPIFNQKKWPKGFKPESNRPYIDPYWTEEVLKQANYQCEICGSVDNLTAHHIESATLNQILANDINNGICLCKSCHYNKAHSDDGCKMIDLRCKQRKE